MSRHSALVAAREWVRQNLGRYRSFEAQLRAAFEAGAAWSADELGSHYLASDIAETKRQAREWSTAVSGSAHTSEALATTFVIGVNYWRDQVTPERSQKKHRRLPTEGETRSTRSVGVKSPSTRTAAARASQVRRAAAREQASQEAPSSRRSIPTLVDSLRQREAIEPCAPFMHRVKELRYTRGVQASIPQKDLVSAFSRYRDCDWGDVPRRDIKRNNRATRQAGYDSILGSYTSKNGLVFWIETDRDFKATTFYLPDER